MKNTVLFVEPRVYSNATKVLNYYVDILGDTEWVYVYYCGKNTKTYWENSDLNKIYEIRELDVEDFKKPSMYSDFMKQKELWESLAGEFVLTTQLDTWIFPDNGYTINDFIKLNKSYIGGNMNYFWNETFIRDKIKFNHNNFNGGLSLRKREDMLKIIGWFPPHPTSNDNYLIRNQFSDAEDVYFTLGCYKLGLPLGDDEYCSHFAVHYLFKDKFFGLHKPDRRIMKEINELYPNINATNPHLHLYKLVKVAKCPDVYLLNNNVRHHIVDMDTFKRMGFDWKYLETISEAEMGNYVVGEPIVSPL